MRFTFAHEVEEARRIHPHLVHQFAQRDELPRPRRHAHLLVAAVERHQLRDHHLQRLGRVAQRLHRRLDAADVAVMIGAEDVDEPVEASIRRRHGMAAIQLGAMVGDVGRQIRPRPVRLLHHAVLVVAHPRRGKPQRPVLLIEEILPAQSVQRLLDRARRAQRRLARPDVEGHAKARQILADARKHPVHPEPGEDRQRVRLGHVAKTVAMHGAKRLRNIRHIRAAIAVLGKRKGRADELAVARADRPAQHVNLMALIIQIVIAHHLIAGECHEARQRIAHGRLAPVRHAQAPRRVGADELDRDALTGTHRRAAVAIPC